MGIFQDVKRLFEKNKSSYRSMNDGGFIQITDETSGITFADGSVLKPKKPVDKRKKLKPVEIWGDLKSQTEPVVDCSDLDSKIKTIKARIKILSDHVSNSNLSQEHIVLGYLEARKKYDKYKEFFAYPTTNEQLISELCKRCAVKVVDVNRYSGTMPQEAIDELATFKLNAKKIRKDLPVVRLIVPDTPETEKRKRDPILLVSSPFGNWDYILGAWDKEVLIVDELIYMGK